MAICVIGATKTELFQETLCQAEPSASRRNLDINWHWRVSKSMRLAVCNACGIEHQSRGVLARRKQSAAPGLRCEWLDDGIICHQYHRQHHSRIRETFGVSWACTARNPMSVIGVFEPLKNLRKEVKATEMPPETLLG